MIKLFIADVSRLDIKKALPQVSAYRRQKVLRCPDDEKKRCSLGVELLLYRALGADKPLSYSLGENGKPVYSYADSVIKIEHHAEKTRNGVTEKYDYSGKYYRYN